LAPRSGDSEAARWLATDPSRRAFFDGLELRGPNDLRHTFSTWLEDAGIPARVIDELMATRPQLAAGSNRAASWAPSAGRDRLVAVEPA
jgi:integrase